MTILSCSTKETENIAFELARLLKPGDCLALIGNLGSGKTVFVRGLALGLGCKRKEVLSPTFVLMRLYKGKIPLCHFDLYRLKDIQALEQIGYEEYFYGQAIAVIEWADKIKEALPKEYLSIELTIQEGNKRLIRFSPKGRHYADYLRKFQRQKNKVS